jgi:mycofactocin radical SAM maturase
VSIDSRGRTGLTEQLKGGLDAPICLTWELTYGCNLACIHCLSSSGRRDPRELTTAEARAVIDELHDLQVFYVNIGGGEPTIRPDFYDLIDYSVARGVGVKFSTNGSTINAARAGRLAGSDYIDVQISLDGADEQTNDAVRGAGSYAAARRAMDHLAAAGFGPFKISVVVTRHNIAQLDSMLALASGYGAQLRLTRLRPSGRGADTWAELHPMASQQVDLHRWLVDHPHVLTGDSFFHLSALGEPLAGLNLCGAGRVVCLIDPVGDVYACPFVLHDSFKAGSVRVLAVRRAAGTVVAGRVRVVRFLRRLPGRVHGGQVLHRPAPRRPRPRMREGPRRGPAGGRAGRRRAVAGPGSFGAGRVELAPALSGSVAPRAVVGPLPWPEVSSVSAASVLVVPLGSTEQHGPHLPLSTDTVVARELAARLAVARPDMVTAPALPYGASGEHAGFAGTLSIGTRVLTDVLVELGRSADAFAGVLFLSAHGGNAEALGAAVATLRHEGRRVRWWAPGAGPSEPGRAGAGVAAGAGDGAGAGVATGAGDGARAGAGAGAGARAGADAGAGAGARAGAAAGAGGPLANAPAIRWDAHAGFTETSLMLSLWPESVRLSSARAGRTEPLPVLSAQLRSGGLASVSPNGVLGDPAGASAEAGARILEVWTAALLSDVSGWPEGD